MFSILGFMAPRFGLPWLPPGGARCLDSGPGTRLLSGLVEVSVIDCRLGPLYVGGVNVCGELEDISRSADSGAQGMESALAHHPFMALHLETDPRK